MTPLLPITFEKEGNRSLFTKKQSEKKKKKNKK